MEYFGLKLGQDLGNRAAHPYQKFRGVPPGEACKPTGIETVIYTGGTTIKPCSVFSLAYQGINGCLD